MIKLKRAYEKPSRDDGSRILVERLWPRGLTKEKAKIDEWLRDLAPSDELRKWYHARPLSFLEMSVPQFLSAWTKSISSGATSAGCRRSRVR